jgi:TusA-related sulfurtransferase
MRESPVIAETRAFDHMSRGDIVSIDTTCPFKVHQIYEISHPPRRDDASNERYMTKKKDEKRGKRHHKKRSSNDRISFKKKMKKFGRSKDEIKITFY